MSQCKQESKYISHVWYIVLQKNIASTACSVSGTLTSLPCNYFQCARQPKEEGTAYSR
uniref:Uncharacterized protein n=1 Tax=Arundo donax TaxID=35708 RepID=A0A0A8Z228_ARUDO